MGGRLSRPQGPGGLTEASSSGSSSTARRPPTSVLKRAIGPIGIVLGAGLLYMYSRTTVQAAKVNARRYREADGGSMNWRNENLRRHGMLKKPDEWTLWQQLRTGAEPDQKKRPSRPPSSSSSSSSVPEDARIKDQQPNFIEDSLRQAKERSRKRNRED